MQNIDRIPFVQPALAIAVSVGVTVFWWNAKGFRGIALALSAAAYAAAIASKYVIQALTLGPAVAALKGQTLAEKAGVRVQGENKWLAMLKEAIICTGRETLKEPHDADHP